MNKIRIELFFILMLVVLKFAPAQDSLKLIFSDEFNDNKNDWPTGKTDKQSCEIKDGSYYISATENSRWFYADTDFDYEKENFRYEVKFISCDPTSESYFGLIYGMYRDFGNYGDFEIYEGNGGQVFISHYYDNKAHKIKNWENEPAFDKKENILVAERKGNIVYHYLNGKLVGVQPNHAYYGIKFGFIIGGKHEVKVDYMRLYTTEKKINVIENAVAEGSRKPLPGQLNTRYSERSPVITADGKRIYMARDTDPEVTGASKEETDIYYSDIDTSGMWSKPVNIGKPLNNDGANFVVSVSADNNSMLIANSYKSDGSADGKGISLTSKTEAGWSVPVKQKIENFENNNDYVSFFLVPGNEILLLSVENARSYGEKDIFVSFLKPDGSWSDPENLGPAINTLADEFNPFVAADGKTMYFASYGHPGYGSADLFVSTRLDSTWKNWSEPKNLGNIVNTGGWDGSFSIPANGQRAIIVSDNGSIENSEDLFSVDLLKARPGFVILLSGRTLHSQTKKPLSASIRYVDLKTGKEAGRAISDPVSGEFKIILPAGSEYGFYAEKEKFYPVSENVSTEGLSSYVEIKRDLFLSPVEEGEVIRLNNLFFEFDKSEIKNESLDELQRLVLFLKKNTSVNIEISGHTDDKGSDAYNLQLSDARAKAVTKYLVSRGIDAARLAGRGYGEAKPVATNLTDEGRALNRRVEFVIVKM